MPSPGTFFGPITVWSPFFPSYSDKVSKSFINGIVAFRTIPRPHFAVLQSKLFPIYFSMQTILPVIMALTYPAKSSIGSRSSIPGVFASDNRWTVLVPITLMFLSGLFNLAVIGPATVKCMRDRKSQGETSY